MSLYTHILSNIFNSIDNDFPVPDEKYFDFMAYSEIGVFYPYDNTSKEELLKRYILEFIVSTVGSAEKQVKQHESLKGIYIYEHVLEFPIAKEFIDYAETLFSLLSTDYGRKKLIDSFTYRFMGPKYINLIPNYEERFKIWDDLATKNPHQLDKDGEKITDFKPIFNLPIKLYHDIGFSVYYSVQYGLRQYTYTDPEMPISIEAGDIVLDCGAYHGETSLEFAHLVGEHGHVYAYEFVYGNVKMFEKNISLNPSLAKRITLVPHPVFEKSGKSLFLANGLTMAPDLYDSKEAVLKAEKDISEDDIMETTTLSIDDMVEKYNIEKVDFIKMDIEGAELSALKGAEQTLKKFKPKLAICMYHKIDDMHDIPKYLNELNIGYKFGFDQYTLDIREKILYAKV